MPRLFPSALSWVLGLATATATPSQSVDDLIRKGDAFAAKMQAADALRYYLPAEKQQPQNVRLLVSIARQYRYLMADAGTKEEKLKLGMMALGFGQRAADLGPNDAEAQLSPAISYGKLLPLQGSRQQVENSPRIKEGADRALRLDPKNDLAWHVLGKWHQVLADVGAVKRAFAPLIYGKLPTGTNEEAVACFRTAIEINPARLMHYVELGRTYANMGRKEEARRFIEKGLAMPETEKDDPEVKRRGRETLAKLK